MNAIIKWPGGKSREIDMIKDLIPEEYDRYIEPFFGGGALYFHLNPRHAAINDLSAPLMNFYRQVKEQTFELNGYRLKAFRVNHNVLCYGYNIVVERAGRFQLEMALEKGIPKMYWSKLQKGEIIETPEATYTPDMVLGPPRKGIKLTYCTDTRPTDGIVKNAAEADLFICEGMYGEPDKKEKAREHKHMTFLEAADMAKRANASQLWLTHFSPSLVRPDDFIDGVRKIFPNAQVGKDGKSVDLMFEED